MYVRTRTLEEVLLMVKEHQGASSTRMQKQEDWKGAAKKRADVTSEADLRVAAFTDVNVSKRLTCLIAGRAWWCPALSTAGDWPTRSCGVAHTGRRVPKYRQKVAFLMHH
jgi:hypothetical protein